ncbi:endonuclease/exonuclease/phosphatase family protein [Streptomyces sp. NPDC092296]|uniref:endonuclease/exonuclease/phosphatase family protein n=1 Tax=Streptomyces sp. NPDC092296 TaxID=3366012 RepID=UPI00381903D9
MAQAARAWARSGGERPDGPRPRPRRLPGLRRWGRDDRGRSSWRRGWVPAVLALLVALLMALHADVPNRIGNLGSLLETFLPWVGLAVPVLLVWALLRRSATALAALLLPVLLWGHLFGGLLLDRSTGGGDLTVLSHNVNAENTDPVGTARALIASGADVVALEELTSSALPVYEKALAGTYPYRAVKGTVALWSRYPVKGTRAVDIKIGWTRALRTEVDTPHGELAVYVAHLPSVRVKFDAGFTADQRDKSAQALGDAIAAEPLRRVVLLGDLNGTMNDRSLADITSQLRSAQGAAGDGIGFSWPASFPMARIDQIMTKGVTPTRSWVLPATASDHLPVAARIRL